MKKFFWLCLIFRATALVDPYGYGNRRNRNRNHQVHRSTYGRPCRGDDKPVCATNGKDYVLFEDECLVQQYNYESARLVPQYERAPGDCPFSLTKPSYCLSRCKEIQCPSSYQPVCATAAVSGLVETLRNECELLRRYCLTQTKWNMVHKGPCINACSDNCGNDYRPICAAYNEEKKFTFINSCHFSCIQRKGKVDWSIIKPGPCRRITRPIDYNETVVVPSIATRTYLIVLKSKEHEYVDAITKTIEDYMLNHTKNIEPEVPPVTEEILIFENNQTASTVHPNPSTKKCLLQDIISSSNPLQNSLVSLAKNVLKKLDFCKILSIEQRIQGLLPTLLSIIPPLIPDMKKIFSCDDESQVFDLLKKLFSPLQDFCNDDISATTVMAPTNSTETT